MSSYRDLLDQRIFWPETDAVGNHQSDASFLAREFHGKSIFHIERHRLFAQDMFFECRGPEGKFAVAIRRQADVDNIDFVGERIKVAKKGATVLIGKWLSALGRGVENPDQLGVFKLSVNCRVHLTHEAATNQSNTYHGG